MFIHFIHGYRMVPITVIDLPSTKLYDSIAIPFSLRRFLIEMYFSVYEGSCLRCTSWSMKVYGWDAPSNLRRFMVQMYLPGYEVLRLGCTFQSEKFHGCEARTKVFIVHVLSSVRGLWLSWTYCIAADCCTDRYCVYNKQKQGHCTPYLTENNGTDSYTLRFRVTGLFFYWKRICKKLNVRRKIELLQNEKAQVRQQDCDSESISVLRIHESGITYIRDRK